MTLAQALKEIEELSEIPDNTTELKFFTEALPLRLSKISRLAHVALSGGFEDQTKKMDYLAPKLEDDTGVRLMKSIWQSSLSGCSGYCHYAKPNETYTCGCICCRTGSARTNP